MIDNPQIPHPDLTDAQRRVMFGGKKQIVYVSPSQIKVWDLCQRKWAFGKIGGDR